MANIYTVTKDISARADKTGQGTVTASYKSGDEVKIYKKEAGVNNVLYGNASDNSAKWINMNYLRMLSAEEAKDAEVENVYDDGVYRASNEAYRELLLRYTHALGSPPKFTKEVDPWATDMPNNIGVGRVMAKTWFSNPAILSICPGNVDYLPGFSKKDKDGFIGRISAKVSGDLASMFEDDNKMDSNGQLYSFKSAFAQYTDVVNLLARTCAIFLGIGDVTNIIPGSSTKLGVFDWAYYSTANSPKSSKKKGLAAAFNNLFDETKRGLNTAVTDDAYIHFFVNHSGASVTESIQTQQGDSAIEKAFGQNSGASELAQNIQFLLGGAVDPTAEKDIEDIIGSVKTSSELLGSFGVIAKNYLKGGRVVFPKMITGMDYSKSISVETTFTSLYGDKRSIFKYVILPALHLLALATPKQLSSNMFTYPFLVRAFQVGNFNTDLAFISNLDLTRGGQEDTCWTVDGLPTEITARFTITPLYNNLMVSSAKHPFMFLQNVALMEYLGTMCGLDLKANNVDTKVKLAENLIEGRIKDIPAQISRALFVDSSPMNDVRNFHTIVFH